MYEPSTFRGLDLRKSVSIERGRSRDKTRMKNRGVTRGDVCRVTRSQQLIKEDGTLYGHTCTVVFIVPVDF